MLQNVQMFFGNLAAALLLGFITSIGWELPLAKLQKLVMSALVVQMSRKPFPKWTLIPFVFFIGVLSLLVANFLLHLTPLSSMPAPEHIN